MAEIPRFILFDNRCSDILMAYNKNILVIRCYEFKSPKERIEENWLTLYNRKNDLLFKGKGIVEMAPGPGISKEEAARGMLRAPRQPIGDGDIDFQPEIYEDLEAKPKKKVKKKKKGELAKPKRGPKRAKGLGIRRQEDYGDALITEIKVDGSKAKKVKKKKALGEDGASKKKVKKVKKGAAGDPKEHAKSPGKEDAKPQKEHAKSPGKEDPKPQKEHGKMSPTKKHRD